MNDKYYDEYMQHNAKLYAKLVERATNGQPLSDNELTFMLTYRKDLRQSMAVSPVKRLLDGVKEVVGIFNIDDNNDKEDSE